MTAQPIATPNSSVLQGFLRAPWRSGFTEHQTRTTALFKESPPALSHSVTTCTYVSIKPSTLQLSCFNHLLRDSIVHRQHPIIPGTKTGRGSPHAYFYTFITIPEREIKYSRTICLTIINFVLPFLDFDRIQLTELELESNSTNSNQI